jgi:hypothetical protein
MGTVCPGAEAGALLPDHSAAAPKFGRDDQRQRLAAGLRCAPLTEHAQPQEEIMQTTKTKAAIAERLSLGALMVILTITNALVFLTLGPYV